MKIAIIDEAKKNKMLIVKTKKDLTKEEMKKRYKNLLEQMRLGLIFCNDEDYDITVVEPIHDWIPVTEELPEDSDKVITINGLSEKVLATDGEEMFIAWRMNGKWYSDDESYYEYTHPITHWIPLPELPNKIKSTEK